MTTKPSSKSSRPVASKKSAARKKYASPIAKVVHETVKDLFNAGVMPIRTMRKFDRLCLTPIKRFEPTEIAALRRREQASQAVFAQNLGLSANLISQWERGEKKPSGASLKLLTLVEKHGLDWVA